MGKEEAEDKCLLAKVRHSLPTHYHPHAGGIAATRDFARGQMQSEVATAEQSQSGPSVERSPNPGFGFSENE